MSWKLDEVRDAPQKIFRNIRKKCYLPFSDIYSLLFICSLKHAFFHTLSRDRFFLYISKSVQKMYDQINKKTRNNYRVRKSMLLLLFLQLSLNSWQCFWKTIHNLTSRQFLQTAAKKSLCNRKIIYISYLPF